MTRWTLCAAIAATLAAAPATASVTLDAGGLGQGLLYPYFSTNNGQTTLFSVHNSSAQGKALKVRVLESHAGAETLTFNVYLPPGATWSSALAQPDAAPGAFATLLKSDDTCTVPQIPDDGVDLLEWGFLNDGGPQTGERSREGFIEIVEMGTLSAELSTAASSNCQSISDRFLNGGPWATQPNAGISAPTGGLRGNAILIDTADGTAFNYSALAFDGLAVEPRQFAFSPTQPQNSLEPRLSDVQVAAGEDIEVRLVDAEGETVTLRYDAEDGYKAISALLSANKAHGRFNVDPSLRARTEWIYSFPTRRSHVSDLVLGTPPPGYAPRSAPFSSLQCEPVPVTAVGRGGETVETQDTVELCKDAGVVRVAAAGSTSMPIFALDDAPLVEPGAVEGNLALHLDAIGENVRSGEPDLDERCTTGLPVWVMALSAYDNDNAQAGRIATFPVEDVAARSTNIVDCSND